MDMKASFLRIWSSGVRGGGMAVTVRVMVGARLKRLFTVSDGLVEGKKLRSWRGG